jgi:hypothetical protein
MGVVLAVRLPLLGVCSQETSTPWTWSMFAVAVTEYADAMLFGTGSEMRVRELSSSNSTSSRSAHAGRWREGAKGGRQMAAVRSARAVSQS